MVRIIGAVLLLTASAALGFRAAGELTLRVRELESMIYSFEFMERELKARLTPLPQLLRQTAQETRGNVKSFYVLCAGRLDKRKEVPLYRTWSDAAEAALLHLQENDFQVVVEVGAVLGRYDMVSQCSALSEARGKLTRSLKKEKELKSKNGKVYQTLGITSGVLLSIILL